MNRYSKVAFLEKLKPALVSVDTLYKQDFINYSGFTADTNELYTEVIAGELLSNIDLLDTISRISRDKEYNVKTHNGTTDNPESNRIEERIALGMYDKEYDHIGIVRNYQVPLKNKRSDSAGKVDLVSEKDGDLQLIELKAGTNKETLLRCALEIETYWRIADLEKLKKEFGCPAGSRVRKTILVPLNGVQHEQYKDKNSNIRRLMEKLDIHCYVFDDEIKVMSPDLSSYTV